MGKNGLVRSAKINQNLLKLESTITNLNKKNTELIKKNQEMNTAFLKEDIEGKLKDTQTQIENKLDVIIGLIAKSKNIKIESEEFSALYKNRENYQSVKRLNGINTDTLNASTELVKSSQSSLTNIKNQQEKLANLEKLEEKKSPLRKRGEKITNSIATFLVSALSASAGLVGIAAVVVLYPIAIATGVDKVINMIQSGAETIASFTYQALTLPKITIVGNEAKIQDLSAKISCKIDSLNQTITDTTKNINIVDQNVKSVDEKLQTIRKQQVVGPNLKIADLQIGLQQQQNQQPGVLQPKTPVPGGVAQQRKPPPVPGR